MDEGNMSDGHSKSRLALGNLTNPQGKRGFSTIEKVGLESFNVDDKDKDTVKRLCVSPWPCTEFNSLKRDLISGVSKKPNENRDPNVAHTGRGSFVSKSSLDIKFDVRDDHRMKGNDVAGKQKVIGTEDGNLNQVNFVDVAICGQVDYSEDHFEVDIIAAMNRKDPNSADFERERVVNANATKDDGSGTLGLPQKDLIRLGISEAVTGNKCPNVGDNVIGFNIYETKDELDGSYPSDTSRTVSENGGDCVNDDNDDAEVTQTSIPNDINHYKNNMDAYNSDYLVMSQSGSTECGTFPAYQESDISGVDALTELKKGNDCAYMSGSSVSARHCSCSFCAKAAYIWLDLNYQDIKARISASKRSQKEAIILAERNSKSKAIGKHGCQSFDNDSNIESQLMCKWRSFFRHMADTLEEEGHKLEASVFPLTDLREKCKTDLESINDMQSEKC